MIQANIDTKNKFQLLIFVPIKELFYRDKLFLSFYQPFKLLLYDFTILTLHTPSTLTTALSTPLKTSQHRNHTNLKPRTRTRTTNKSRNLNFQNQFFTQTNFENIFQPTVFYKIKFFRNQNFLDRALNKNKFNLNFFKFDKVSS